ncbi:MAG: putative Ig domain-containing protein [Lysobacteraceae bacterium]
MTQSQVTYYRNDGSVASGSPVKTFGYNVFGDLVTESDLLEGVPNSGSEVWATAYRYYDALGRNTLTVDALGYVTETKYNATGEAIETIEYARALSQTPNANTRPGLPAPGDASTGDNRISRWGYDALGRKTSEISVRQYRRIDGSTGSRDVAATYGYDNEGRVTAITDDTGITLTTYDAIGRTISVQEPTRATLVQGVDAALGGSTALDLTSNALYEQRSPYTTMAYDAFGNAVAVRRYANGKNGASAAVADDSRDQVQLMRYDWQGRAVWERDGEGAVVTRTYDAADNVIGVRYTLSGNEGRSAIVRVTNSYDKTGRQKTTLTERDQYLSGVFQNTVIDAGETVSYNAFGEITGKTMSGLSGSMAYAYDATGRLISSNDSGAVRNFGYNLAGHQVRTSQNAYLSATDGVVVAVTMTRVDKLGRALEVTLPSHNATASTTSTITQRVDRWGNVVQIIDARGYQTDYEYNSLNQLVRETRPLVKVVAENGGVSWLRPVNQWYYDALGRLVATRDANGNLRSNEYDATGRMTATRDAYGNVTRHAYDALGNQRLTQNALGYLTFKEYDRRGQVTAIGDYLPASNGTSREKTFLQRYVLNQNGDRIEVKNALNFAAQYDYDSRKQVIRSKSAMGVVLEYAYDAAARRIRERNGLSLAANAPTYLDRESETVRLNELSWDYDVFGRVIDHNNLSGRDSDYSYNASSGQMTGETAVGGSGIAAGNGSKTISYYANGRIRQVIEGTTTYRYEYDAAGNRTVEEVTTADTYGMQVRTLTRTTYDSNNRVERVTQDDVLTGKRVFDLITEYDANGNRRHVRAVSGYGPNVDGILVSNSAPVTIRTVDDRTVRKGLTSQFRLLFTDIFRDAEQDALSLTITQGSGAALPAWLVASRDPNTGEIVFTANPSAGLADQDIVVRLTATETANAANTISTTFTVRVRSNTAPALIQAGDIALRVKTNQPWNKDLITSDYFRDADVGDVLSLSIENALPSWLTIDAGNPGAIRLSGTPTAPGTFIVRLRATDQQGAFVVKQFEITTAPNSTPGVVAAPTPVDAIISRQFDWTRDLSQVFADLDGDRMQVTAKLSNGAALPAWMSFQYLYDQATPEIKFTGNVPTDEVNGRVYSIVLTATDVEGAFTTTTLTVNVFANRAPAPTANTLVLPPLRVNDNYSQTFAISALFNDPESDTLSLATLFPQGSALPAWLNMTVDYTAKTVTFWGRPTVNTQAGSFAFDVRATDIAGLTGVKSFSIVVGTDNAPARSAVPLADRTLSINRSFTYTLPDGLFTDADGDAFTLLASMVVQVTEIEPGTPTFNWVDYQPLPSWLTFNAATRTFSGTVPANQPVGNFTVRVRASDSRGRISTADNEFVGGANDSSDGDIRFNIQTWTNTAPFYNVGTLPNRTLVHGGAVNFAMPGGAFTEPDGDVMTYSAQVLIGSTWTNISALGLSINATTGQITGTATNLTQASYSARIIASDPQGLTGIGSFTFSATNTPPTVGSIPTQNAGRNQAFSLALSTFFADVNNDPLTYSATGLPAGLTLNTATGAITGAATAALGSYTVTVSASDGRGGSIGTSFTLNVVNSAPVAPTIPNQTATAGAAWSYTVPAFTDPNGDVLTYSASGLPAWMSFNATTRVLSGTAGPVGSWTINITATDPSGVSANRSFTVTTPSTPPVYGGGLSNQSASPGVGFSYTVPAGAFTDPNGDALTYSADANGVALPAWLSFNAATRTFSGTPGSAGSWTIRVMASDGTSTASGLFTISTANVGPVYNGTLPARSGTSGTGVSWTLPAGAFTDANGDALTYTLEVERPGYWETYWLAPGEPDTRWVEPVWVAASAVNLSIAANGTISGTLQGLYSAGYDNVYQYYYDYNMRITARDPSNASAVGAFTVSANVAPVAPGIGTLTARQNSAYAYTLPAFSDANGNALSYSVSNLPPGLSFNSGTRAISGTPPTAGSWTVTYTANDGNGGVTNTTFTLTVLANNAPTPPSVGTQTGGVGGSLSLTLPAFTDADYDALSYSVSNLPPGLSFNPATRTISGTPTTVGSWTVTYTANDGRGGVSNTTFTFTINASAPANQAPVVSVPLDDQWTMTGDYFVYTIPAGSFIDPDNNPLTYSATQASAAALPAWLSFNASTRTFSGSPGGINNQTWTIRVRATDPSGLSITDDFLLYKEGTGGGQLNGVPVDDPSLQSAAIAPEPESLDGELMSRSWDIASPRESPTPLPGPDVEPFGIAQSIVPVAAPAPQSDDDLAVAVADTLIAAAVTTTAASSIPTNDVVPVAAAIDDTEAVARVYSFDMGTGPALAGSAAIVEIQPTGNSSATAPVPMINALATSVPVQIKDEWFVYDAENRLKLVGGQLVGAAGAQGTYIGLGASGVASYELMYDAVGQVVGRSVKSGTNQIVYRTTYDLRGRKQYEFHGEYLNPVNFEFGGISKQYTYDAADRMIETRSYYQNGTRVQAPLDGEGFPQGPDMHVSGWISSAETFTYDADGRLTLQINLERNNGINGIQWFEPWDYDDTLQRTSLTVLIEDSRVMYTDQFGNSGYDSIGRVSVYRYTAKDISWATHTYTSSYEGWEGYVEKFISGVSTNNNYRATTNTLTYDAFGKLVKQIENTPLPSNLGVLEDRARAYTYNGDGRVQTRREGKIVSNVFTQTADASGAKSNYLFVHAAGQQQAELREGGQIRTWNGGTYDTPQIQTLNGSGNYAAGGGTVTVQQGETLQSLAQRVYGNSSLWYVLADANGLSDPDAGLIAGTQLNTPKVTVSNNDANTFRPYDPSEAIGPTSPGLPYITPPPKKSCNVIAMVLMVVVAVVVTVFTAGAAAVAMSAAAQGVGFGAALGTMGGSIMAVGGSVLTGGAIAAGAGMAVALGGSITAATMAAAAVGGFMGSVASQVVGKALGVVEHFSLRSAVASGLTAGLTAGVGSTGLVSQLAGSGNYAHVARGAINSAIGSVTSYAANRLAGIETSFSWKSIAAGAVSGAISAGISKALGFMPDSSPAIGSGDGFRNDLFNGIVGGVTRTHVRRAFGFDDPIDYGSIVADAFGNAIANHLVQEVRVREVRSARLRQFGGILERFESQGEAQGLTARSMIANIALDVDPAEVEAVIADTIAFSSGETNLTPREHMGLTRRYLGMVADENGVRATAEDVENTMQYFRRRGMFASVEVLDLVTNQAYAQSFMDELSSLAAANTPEARADRAQWEREENSPVLGAASVDNSAAFVGSTAKSIAAEIEDRPWLKFALVGLDVAAGPSMFVIREAFNASPAGAWVQEQQANAISRISEEYVRKPGYEADRATDAAVGIFTVGMLIVGGAWAWAKHTSGLSRRIDAMESRLARQRQINQNVDSEAGDPQLYRLTRIYGLASRLNERFKETGVVDMGLVRQFAAATRHEVRAPDGSTPRLVTLGPSRHDSDPGTSSFYRDRAEETGGYYFGMSDQEFERIGHGLNPDDAFKLQWAVNQQFLDDMVDRGMSFRFVGYKPQEIRDYGKGFTFNELSRLEYHVSQGRLVWNGTAFVPRRN